MTRNDGLDAVVAPSRSALGDSARRVSHTLTALVAMLAAVLVVSCAHSPGASPAGGKSDTGGQAAAVDLKGSSWRVEDIEGHGTADNADVTVAFDPAAQVSGNTSCSDYNAQATIQSGERIEFSTMSVRYGECSAELKDQERRFLKAVQYVRSYRVDSSGKLHLIDGEGNERMRLERR